MRMAFVTVAVALCLGGCDDAPDDPIQGTWAASLTTGDCVLAFSFHDGKFEQDRVCTLADKSIGFEATVGGYTVSGTNVTLNQTMSSCPSDAKASRTLAWVQSGTSLRLQTVDFAIVLQKAPDTTTSSGVVTFGCFDDKYTFTSSPYHTLP